jgi:hypothetical protein
MAAARRRAPPRRQRTFHYQDGRINWGSWISTASSLLVGVAMVVTVVRNIDSIDAKIDQKTTELQGQINAKTAELQGNVAQKSTELQGKIDQKAAEMAGNVAVQGAQIKAVDDKLVQHDGALKTIFEGMSALKERLLDGSRSGSSGKR